MAYTSLASAIQPNSPGWWDNSLASLTQATPPQTMPNLDVNGVLAATPAMNVGQDPSMWGQFSNWMDNSGVLGKRLSDGTQVQGWGAPALGAISGLMNGWFGMQQLKVAKDTLQANKDQFRLNFDATKNTTNAALADRQAARVASNPGAYQSVGSYMNQYGIKG